MAKVSPIEVPVTIRGADGVYLIPVSPRRLVAISGPWPLSDHEWTQLFTVLDLFRPGLTEPLIDAEIVDSDDP